MSVDEAIELLDQAIADYEQDMVNVSEELAITAKSIIVHRIQNVGIGETYSDKKIPAYLFLLNEARLDTSSAKTFVRSKAKAKNPEDRYTNWKEIREAHGNQTAFVDLTYTGRMLNNLGVIGTEIDNDLFVTVIGGFTDEVKKKLDWNAKRYGDFLVLEPDELKEISAIGEKRISELMKKVITNE